MSGDLEREGENGLPEMLREAIALEEGEVGGPRGAGSDTGELSWCGLAIPLYS